MSPRLPTSTSSATPSRARVQRRALLVVVGLVVLAHLALLGAAGRVEIGTERDPAASTTVAVRTIDAAAESPRAMAAALDRSDAPSPGSNPVPPTAKTKKASARLHDSPQPSDIETDVALPKSDRSKGAPITESTEPATAIEADVLASAEPRMAEPETDAGLLKVVLAAPPPAMASFLADGERAPPVYRTVLPGPVTLRYQLRRGFISGTAEIRWRPAGDRYSLQFDARVAGISLLSQSSQGELDATGLAPLRFLDQRARKAPRAANFSRDTGTISFSGSTAQWPLLAGTQDRLSWMIQLGGIVAADPSLARSGSISMVLISARGDAAVRSVRFVGRESAETASGSVPALKFVVDGHSAYDDSFEIWLDPARGYLPAHATSRNSAGEAEFELLLQRTEP